MGRDRSRSMSSSSSGRGVQSATWDGETGHRIHVSDLAAGVSRKEIERAFSKFGSINEIWVATNPPCFAFINFKHRSDADKAIRELDGKVIGSTRVGVSWARTRTYGGRNRGGRGAPYGSYRSGGGGGSRRRSRSRSRSNSRHKRRRSRSRSRSRDRYRRRSPSPRDRKRSRNDKPGNDERKDDRKKSKTPQSNSRSRSHSTPRREFKKSQSRDSSVHDEPIPSSSAIEEPDENNIYDQSPLAAGDE